MMTSTLQKPKRVLYTEKLKKSSNMTAIYKEDLFFSKLCLEATLLHDYDLQKKTQIFSEDSLLQISKKCCKVHMKRTHMNER